MGALTKAVDDHETGRLGLHVLPTNGGALGRRERPLQITLGVVRISKFAK
jgi:hypothetical protein